MLHATHASKVVLDLEQRRGDPALLLVAVPPMIHALRLAFDLRHHAFDQVGRVETAAQVLRHAEAMQREFTCNQISIAIYYLTVEYRSLQRDIEAKEESVLNCASRSFDCGGGGMVLVVMSLELDWDLMVLDSLAGRYAYQGC